MPKRTNKFQRLVTLIEDQLQPLEVEVTESKEFWDSVTGEAREVDIAIEAKVGIHPVTIGIECIDRKRPAPVTWIEQIQNRNQSLEGLHKTVAVSSSGFTKPALAKAAHYNIVAITLQEAEESDWVARVRQLLQLKEFGVEDIVGERKGPPRIFVALSSPPPYPPPPQFRGTEETMLYDHTGRLLGSVEQAVVDALNESAVMEKAAQELAPNTSAPFFLEPVYRNGTYVVDAAGNKHQVSHIRVEGEFHKLVSAIPLERTIYEDAAILHGKGEVLGQQMQVVASERENSATKFTVAIGEQTPPPGKRAD